MISSAFFSRRRARISDEAISCARIYRLVEMSDVRADAFRSTTSVLMIAVSGAKPEMLLLDERQPAAKPSVGWRGIAGIRENGVRVTRSAIGR